MSDSLISVGIDVGTTSTQLIVSRLKVENRASGFSVPELKITQREILYKSPVHFTPLVGETRVDGEKIRELVMGEYEKAGITRQDVDTGAIIITGESSRKENAETVLNALSNFAGDFVVATAGPDLESILAAKGAGAVAYSQKTGQTVLHMDIGGGTSNLALIEDGVIVQTGCFHVGGRLLKIKDGNVIYVAPCLRNLDIPKEPGALAEILTNVLEMAAGLRPPDKWMDALFTKETTQPWIPPQNPGVISFSGGVADCIRTDYPNYGFGDMGPVLGKAIRASRLCRGEYRIGEETIRATVIGAGCHSAQLSGSTVFYQNVTLPIKNLPVTAFTRQEQERGDFPDILLKKQKEMGETLTLLSMPGYAAANYNQVSRLGEMIIKVRKDQPVYLCLEGDMAKALGHFLSLRLPADTPILCIDSVALHAESYMDIGTPVGPALPVVIKTLVLAKD